MGAYEITEDSKELHYTGDGWTTCKVTDKEIKDFRNNKIGGFELFTDGREVY